MVLQRLLLALGCAFLLSACVQEPVVTNSPVNFQTDRRILRGTWSGQNTAGKTLTLKLKALDPSKTGYFTVGSLKLGDLPELPFGAHVKLDGGLQGAAAGVHALADAGCTRAVSGHVDAVFDEAQHFKFDLCGEVPVFAGEGGKIPEFHFTLTDGNGSAPQKSDFVLRRQPDPKVAVRGEIVHRRGEPYTYDGDFVFTKASHAIVRFWYSESAMGDAPAELLEEITIKGITSFPIKFEIVGDVQQMLGRTGDYFLGVEVISGDGGPNGNSSSVGDLTNEMYTPVRHPGDYVVVEVTGLEPCASDNSGGYCVGE